MSLEEQVERYYIEMENELLLNIAKKVAVDKPMEIDKWSLETNSPIVGSGGVNEWQLERLKELGGLTEENAKIIAKYSKKSKKDIEKIFERAREIGTEVDKKQLELGIKAGILNEIDPVVEDIVVKNIISNAMQETLTTFNKQNNSLLVSSGREYTKIVNTVSTEVMAGTKTVTKAMQDAVTKLAEKGLTGFTARNGAQWSPEAYTKMVLRTNTRQTTNKIQEERMQLAGNNYVEISQHMGARPLCAEDQGKIFSLNDDTTPIEDGLGNKIKVYAWSQSSYGEPAGILGINCGHSRYAFIPGMSIHRERKINKAENDEAYQERQTQRYYERQIRNKKREIEMLKETGAEPDYIKSKQKQLSSFNSQYNSWLKETDRYRDYGNEWIGSSYKNTLGISSGNKSNTKKEYIGNENTKLLDKTIKKYENTIYENDFESAFVFQDDGEIFKFTGGKQSVDIFDVKLNNATVTHNHPIDGNVYRSFGEDDFVFIKNTKAKNVTLRVTTPEFDDTLKKIKDIDIDYNEIYYEAITKCMLNETLEVQAEAMKILKDRGYVKYERRIK